MVNVTSFLMMHTFIMFSWIIKNNRQMKFNHLKAYVVSLRQKPN